MEKKMFETNLLFTSINWRAAIIKKFVNEFRTNPLISGKIITVDTDKLAAGSYFSDKHYVVSPYNSDSYLDELMYVLKKENINIIIPNTDRDCLFFKDLKNELESQNIRVFMPDSNIIKILCDKYSAFDFFKNNNILTPDTFIKETLSYNNVKYPLIVKPRRDSGSKDVFTVKNQQELDVFIDQVINPVIQTKIIGIEYSVDVVSDFQGNVIAALSRKRLSVKSGTSIKTVADYNEKIIDLTYKICKIINSKGIICIQFIIEEATDLIYLIEINTRIGSAALLSIEAGINIPEIIHKLNNNMQVKIDRKNIINNFYMLYYHEPIFLNMDEIHDKGDNF